MEELNKEANAGGVEDPKRAAYMIAWRDRHIKKQEELLKGYEEQSALMEALLAFALLQAATWTGKEWEVRIPKMELRAALDRYTSDVTGTEEEFVIRFAEKREPEDGREQEKE